eukprot:gene1014-2616_t
MPCSSAEARPCHGVLGAGLLAAARPIDPLRLYSMSLLAVLLCSVVPQSLTEGVVELTDETFEHLTQACTRPAATPAWRLAPAAAGAQRHYPLPHVRPPPQDGARPAQCARHLNRPRRPFATAGGVALFPLAHPGRLTPLSAGFGRLSSELHLAGATVPAATFVVWLDPCPASTGATTGDWFVKFYAPWCGHCKKLVPIWDELAADLEGKVNIAKVDCTVHSTICSRFKVKGYPTLQFFSQGRLYKYQGARGLDELKDFATGGFEQERESSKAVPGDPSFVDNAMDLVWSTAEDAAQLITKKTAVMALTLFCGAMIGACVALVVALRIQKADHMAPRPAGAPKSGGPAPSKKDKDL